MTAYYNKIDPNCKNIIRIKIEPSLIKLQNSYKIRIHNMCIVCICVQLYNN